MYVYSLLMHFACVRQSDKWFQEKCYDLNPKCQTAVHKFLNITCQYEKFDRNSIRQAISDSTPAKERKSFLHLQSTTPISTPIKGAPLTPMSNLLDAKNFETQRLQAQLEGEKHERHYLETQNQKLEERLNKYSKLKLLLFSFFFKWSYRIDISKRTLTIF